MKIPREFQFLQNSQFSESKIFHISCHNFAEFFDLKQNFIHLRIYLEAYCTYTYKNFSLLGDIGNDINGGLRCSKDLGIDVEAQNLIS